MFHFRFTLPLSGLCFLTSPGQIPAGPNPLNLALAVNRTQNGITLHAGLGVLALVLTVLGWVRRNRRKKPS